MSQKIVVFTVTGDQGSSVARYLLKDGHYKVVGITRNPSSEKAKELAKQGKGDLLDPSSYTSALEGAHGAFVNADFWAEYFTNGMNADACAESEYKQSTSAIEACAKAGIKHIVYSTLDGVGYVPHFDSKAKVFKWAKEQGYPVTGILTSHYISNLVKFGSLTKNDDGTFTVSVPAPDDCPLPNFAVEQTGGWVVAAFNNPDKYMGKTIDACSENLTIAKWAEIIASVTGKTVKTQGITKESFLNESEKYQQVPELYLNYKGFLDGKVPRDVEASKAIYPDQWDTKAWIEQSEAFKKMIA